MGNELNTQNKEEKGEQPQPQPQPQQQQQTVKEFQYKIGFNQSVSSGVVALEGYIHFDDGQALGSISYFMIALENFKENLKQQGFTLATDAAPKRNIPREKSESELALDVIKEKERLKEKK